MDEREKNLRASVIVAALSMVAVFSFYALFFVPIEDIQRQKVIDECIENGYACVVEPSMFPIVLGVIPFLIFVGVFNYLEKKRVHNWRSWR